MTSNFMHALEDVQVGDKLCSKTLRYGYLAPHYNVVTVKKITPTGKFRLNTGTLIDPTRTHLVKYTKEMELERNNWMLKELLIDIFRAIEHGTNKVFSNTPPEEINELIGTLLPVIKNLKGYNQHNSDYCNRLTMRIPIDYKELMEERNNIIREIMEDEK